MVMEIIQLIIKKNQDYGNAIFKQKMPAISLMLDMKISRLGNLIKNNDTPNFESIKDTLNDIIGYALLGKIIQDEKA